MKTQAIEAEFSTREMAALIGSAVAGGLMPALQPILLGTLVAGGRLDAVELGQAATAEGLGLALGVTAATRFLPVDRLRLCHRLAGLGLILCNLATPFAPPEGVIAIRALNGCTCGILLWLVIGMFARVAQPGRTFATYTIAQSSCAFLLSTLVANLIAPRFGATASYVMVAVLGLCVLGLSPLIPRRYAPLLSGTAAGASGPTGWGGQAGLAAIFLYLSAVIAFWAYLLPVGQALGHGAATIGLAVSLGIGTQIAAGVLALAFADRLAPVLVLAGSCLIAVLGLLSVASGTVPGWYLGIVLFAFAWMFCPAFHIPFLIEIDPSRRSAVFVGSGQLFGVSFGPFAASLILGEAGAISVIWLSGCFFLLSALIVVGLRARRPGAEGSPG